MNKLDFIVANSAASTPLYASIHIIIDGVNLIDKLKDFEKPFVKKEGSEIIAGDYSGFNAKILYANLTNSEVNQNSEKNKSDILDCECGNSGCWPFALEVILNDNSVIWTNFEQVQRNKESLNYWDYSNFGSFEFEKTEYLKKLEELTTIKK